MKNITLKPGQLRYEDLKRLLDPTIRITLDKKSHAKIISAAKCVQQSIADGKVIYGVNTGFGKLANTRIPQKDLQLLQQRIILSHAAGTGELLSDNCVRLILILKINSLARGYSGVQLTTINALIKLVNANIYPCIPSQGSVGASGDLAPLAHLSAVLIGEGFARYQGKIISAKAALAKLHLKPLTLSAKEGLALLNGTQVSSAIALEAMLIIENIFHAALLSGAMSVDACRGSVKPFDQRIQSVRGQAGQIKVATIMRKLLAKSEIMQSHQRNCTRVQDPYSLRCQPQVMGACLDQLNYQKNILMIEANAVSDNPLVFADDDKILSGGNFHAEPVALAADSMAVAIAEIGAIAERRIALLIDPHFSGLPPFLVNNAGLNSGFMLPQVTAAALASENKVLAHPASVDSIPTSANQEDHVSMATFAAHRLGQMVENTLGIIGIELLAAAQGLDLLRPLKSSAPLEAAHQLIRKKIKFYREDRYFAPDIESIKNIISQGQLSELISSTIWL